MPVVFSLLQCSYNDRFEEAEEEDQHEAVEYQGETDGSDQQIADGICDTDCNEEELDETDYFQGEVDDEYDPPVVPLANYSSIACIARITAGGRPIACK